MKIVKHILGAYNPETLQQCCIMCGDAIIDYTHTVSSDGTFPTWPEGEFYMQGKKPTAMFTTLKEEDEQYVEPCDIKR